MQKFQIQGVSFEYSGNYDQCSTLKNINLLKPRHVIDLYCDLLPKKNRVNIFELGVFEAGSAIILALMNPHAYIVGIDFTNKPHLDDIVEELGLADRIRIYHNVQQQDEKRLRQIIDYEFKGEGIDFVIDDASHFYQYTRDSFEVVFPYLNRGAKYVIEDWNWAHMPGQYQTTKWADKDALTNLVFELVMLAGSGSPDVESIYIKDISAVVCKASGPNPGERLDISNGIRNRSKDFVLI